MPNLNINAQSITQTPQPALSAPAGEQTSFISFLNTPRPSHNKYSGSCSLPDKTAPLTRSTAPKIKISKAPSPAPEPRPQTAREARRSAWQLKKIKNGKKERAEKKSASAATSRSTTPGSTISASTSSHPVTASSHSTPLSSLPSLPPYQKLKRAKLGIQNPQAWTSVSGIGIGSSWGINNGKGYGGIMYSGKRRMNMYENYEQTKFSTGERDKTWLEADVEMGYQRGYEDKKWYG